MGGLLTGSKGGELGETRGGEQWRREAITTGEMHIANIAVKK